MTSRSVNPRLVLFLAVAAGVAAVAWSTRQALTPFLFGLVLAYLLAPVVSRVHRALPASFRKHRHSRPAAILLVYFAAFAIVIVAAAIIVPPVVRQAQELLGQAPALAGATAAHVERLIDQYYLHGPGTMRRAIDELLRSDAARSLTAGILSAAQRAVLGTAGAITGTVDWLLALIIVPIWLVYVLNDKDRVMSGAIGLIPRDIRADVESVRVICDRVLSAYVRGQLVIAVVLGVMVTIALLALRVPYALLLGFTAGLFGVIPFLGAILGAVPAVAVAASQSLRLAVLVVIAFVLIQIVDNTLVSPRLQGRSVALNPAVIMVVLVIGQTMFGPLGLLAAVPAAAILRDVLHYLYLRVGEDRPPPLDALITVGHGRHATAIVRLGAKQDAADEEV